MSTGKPLNAKLFLEGIEVPLIGASITHTVNQAAIAYIDVVPEKEIKKIKPRTHVAIYARDYNSPLRGRGNLNFPHVLAFEGEVFGFDFGKKPSSRSFTIKAIDVSSYWDNVVAYFFNALQSLGKGAERIGEAGQNQKDLEKTDTPQKAVTHSISSFFLQTIQDTLEESDENDFLDGFVRVIQSITKLNEFYQLAEERLRINDRILLNSSKELTELLEEQRALDWFEGVAGRNSGYRTLRQVINKLMSIIFHDFVSVPFPAKVRKDKSDLDKDPVQFTGDDVSRTIGNFIFKPNLYMLPPPQCNIFFPDEYSSFQFSRNFFQEPTRLIYKPEMPQFGQQSPVSLPHSYVPESFRVFMQEEGSYPDEVVGEGGLQVKEDQGHREEEDPDEESSKTNQGKLQEAQFLTNEELLKGILLAQEQMVPASSQFRNSLEDAGRKKLANGVAEYLFFKKRFQGRKTQITSHLKLSVVPGFPVLILDDSEADQSTIAYCSSVTHRIYATQGGNTNVQLSYARPVDEQDVASEQGNEPLIPPWFRSSIFGEKKDPPESNSAKEEVANQGKQNITPDELSTFYKEILGDKGYRTINDISNEKTVLGAVRFLLNEYRSVREKNKQSVTEYIARRTERDYVTLRQSFKFLGSGTSRDDLDTTQFVQFFGDRFEGKNSDGTFTRDRDQIESRRQVVLNYRNKLRSKRGFRG